ncbi:PepSY-associated TM region [Pseudidiomarina planktonica]|uniref:PepSY-associated TM region n=1 Tax=Pseudidiomarina planktonica TaxID=1323738 RepID=A0A1Y6EL34_9GAMM|nr:PepSY domain-containing protein [Pseudidiomarina planktonica]RUO65754.1 hypothetical protein CWI77_04775 [Pseudidiomarina planktonica]SMQ63039.1 PepSY-associated TM region [Pseudidiomarina planktonica]
MMIRYSKFRRWHHWLSLVFGLQLLIWSLTGSYMVWVQLPFIHGTALTQNTDQPLGVEPPLAALAQVQQTYPSAQEVSLLNRHIGNSWRYVAEVREPNQSYLVNLDTLSQMVLTEQDIRDLADMSYTGTGKLNNVTLLTTAVPDEVSMLQAPVWRADFADALGTTLYLSATTGAVLTQRHDYWRLFDVMWMLHIMDYDTRSDITTPWLQAFIFGNMLLIVTGFVLLIPTFKKIRKAADKRVSSFSGGA